MTEPKPLVQLYNRLKWGTLRARLLHSISAFIILSLVVTSLSFILGSRRVASLILFQQVTRDAGRIHTAFDLKANEVVTASVLLANDSILQDALNPESENLTELNRRLVPVRERFKLDFVQVFNRNDLLRANILSPPLNWLSSISSQVQPADQPQFLKVSLSDGDHVLILGVTDLPQDAGMVVTGVDLQAELTRIIATEQLTEQVCLEVLGSTLGAPDATCEFLPDGISKGRYSQQQSVTIGGVPMQLHLSLSTRDIDAVTQQSIQWIVFISALIFMVLILIISATLSAALRPVNTLAKIAQNITQTGLLRTADTLPLLNQSSVNHPYEIAQLTQAFNKMISELKELYRTMERKVELRTREVQRKSAQQQASIEIGQSITKILDLEELLKMVSELFITHFHFRTVSISLLDDRHERTAALAGESPGPFTLDSVIVEGMPVQDWMRHNPQPLVQCLQPLDCGNADEVAQCLLALPLQMGSQLLGVLYAFSDQDDCPREEELPILQSLANQVSAAIRNASLYDTERNRRQLAETFYRTSQVLSGTLEVHRVLELTLENISEFVAYDRAAVLLFLDDQLLLAAARGQTSQPPIDQPVLLQGKSPLDAVLKSRQPLMIADLAEDGATLPLPDSEEDRAWLGIPMINSNEVVGILILSSNQPDVYDQNDVILASTFAAQSSLALSNARLYDETRFNAIHDALTGLFNRRYFYEMFNRVVHSKPKEPLALLILDLDNFKHCNDHYGHLAGDDILREAADIISHSLRKDDSAFRYGGEEFTILLPGINKVAAKRLAERLRAAIESHSFTIRSSGQSYNQTTSIGVAVYPENGRSLEALVNAADLALLQAKNGRNRVQVFSGTQPAKTAAPAADERRLTTHSWFDTALVGGQMEHYLVESRQRGLSAAVVVLDLDGVKLINKTLGYAVGDDLLQAVHQRLEQGNPWPATVARFGGDKYLFVIPNLQTNAVDDLLDAIPAVFDSAFTIQGYEFHISASGGLSLYPQDGDDLEQLQKNADTAMYQAKKEGGNRLQRYNSSLNQEAIRHFEIERHLHNASTLEQLFLQYQPQVDIRTGEVIAIEALLRWNHPWLGLIPPGEFIPLAEENGCILELGDWVLRNVCRQIKEWQNAGVRDLRVAVNVSARQVLQQGFTDNLRAIFDEYHVCPEMIELELTESTLINNLDLLTERLNSLKDLGVGIVIDDFGAGYSSFTYLWMLPLDKLKLDKQFIHSPSGAPSHRQRSLVIIGALTSLTNRLNLSIVAEGVETKQEVDDLVSVGCHQMQGFYFSRPQDPNKVFERVSAAPAAARAQSSGISTKAV